MNNQEKSKTNIDEMAQPAPCDAEREKLFKDTQREYCPNYTTCMKHSSEKITNHPQKVNESKSKCCGATLIAKDCFCYPPKETEYFCSKCLIPQEIQEDHIAEVGKMVPSLPWEERKNTTPQWIYDFNKFLIEDRTTGEIIEFIRQTLNAQLEEMENMLPIEKKEEYQNTPLSNSLKISALSWNSYRDQVLAIINKLKKQ